MTIHAGAACLGALGALRWWLPNAAHGKPPARYASVHLHHGKADSHDTMLGPVVDVISRVPVAAARGVVRISWWREPTKGQYISFAAGFVGWMLDGFDFTIYSLSMVPIAKEFGVDIATASSAITLTLLFRLVGGGLAGAMADRWGRKLPLMLSILWFAGFNGAVAFAPSFAAVLTLRALFGIGNGAEWAVGSPLALENWPKRSRAIAATSLQAAAAVGYLLAAVVSSRVLPVWGWRGLFLLSALPAIVVIPIRLFVPESTAWKESTVRAPPPPMRALWGRELRTKLIWASTVMSLVVGSMFSLASLYPVLLATELHKDPRQVGVLVTAFTLGSLVAAVGAGVVASRTNGYVATVLTALLGLPVLPIYVGVISNHLGLGAALAGVLLTGYLPLAPLLLMNLFPIGVRARCMGLSMHAGGLVAAFVPMILAGIHQETGIPLRWVILVGTGLLLVALAASILLRPRALRTPSHAADAGSRALS